MSSAQLTERWEPAQRVQLTEKEAYHVVIFNQIKTYVRDGVKIHLCCDRCGREGMKLSYMFGNIDICFVCAAQLRRARYLEEQAATSQRDDNEEDESGNETSESD